MTTGLSISDVIGVTVALPPIAAAVRNFGNLLIAGSSNIIDVTERIRTYASLSAVGVDFGTSADEYLAAQVFFGQSPAPSSVQIGRWAQTATAGLLHGGPLAASEQLMSAWTGITTGSTKFTIDGTLRTLSPLSFAGCANMNAVAAVINTALSTWGTCTWNAVYNRFEFASATSGATSSFSYGTATGSGVDITAQIRATAATGAPAPVGGIAAETALAAVTALAALSNNWYGLYMASQSAVAADVLAIAGFIESATPSRIFGNTTQDANTLVASSTTDIAAQLQAAKYQRTFTQYSASNKHAAASIFGRTFVVDFTGANTTITVKFQTEPGVAPETLNETQAATATAKSCNVFVNYNNGVAIVQQGTMANGYFFDEVHGLDWLQNKIQTDLFNSLFNAGTKIPQTDAGVSLLVTTVSGSCDQAVTNGLFAPGTWTGPAMGALASGQALTKGYYVYAPSVASQSSADRAARKAPTLQVAGKLAGAVHFANVVVNVNR